MFLYQIIIFIQYILAFLERLAKYNLLK